jgi:hypothetical protein
LVDVARVRPAVEEAGPRVARPRLALDDRLRRAERELGRARPGAHAELGADARHGRRELAVHVLEEAPTRRERAARRAHEPQHGRAQPWVAAYKWPILFFVAVVPGFLTAQGNATARLAVLGALYVGIATAVHIAIVLLAAELRPWLLEGPRSLWVRRGLSLLLAGAAAWLAFSTSR